MSIGLWARKLRRNLRDYGLGITLRKTAGALFRGVYRTCDYRIYRANLYSEPPPPSSAGGIGYRLASAEEDWIISQIEALEDWLTGRVALRLREGGICVVALDGRSLAGFNLISFGEVKIPLIDGTWAFKPHYAWSEQITVHPDYRGRGIALNMRRCAFAELKQRGIVRFYGGALKHNRASLHLSHKAGFREILEIRYRRVLWFPKTYSFVRVKS